MCIEDLLSYQRNSLYISERIDEKLGHVWAGEPRDRGPARQNISFSLYIPYLQPFCEKSEYLRIFNMKFRLNKTS